VVVGLVLMATVLVSALLALGAHRKQLRTANDQLIAVRLADDLLNQFVGSREGIPAAATGTFSGRPGWAWRTRPVDVVNAVGISLTVIRLEIFLSDGTTYATVELAKETG
jgi:hypothetical protein